MRKEGEPGNEATQCCCQTIAVTTLKRVYTLHQELMSRPKGGRSVQLRGTAFESERSRHFPYMDLFSSGA